ncbi:MAG: ATP-binding protein, partial [Planctomycetes bacterium]|nr:ATP-binding protein [Planctomycetota bacterium]
KTDSIRGHKPKLTYIIVNLIQNALESMVKTPADKKEISIQVYQENNKVYLKVADKGCGIDDENIKKIFNQGYSTKKNGHGLGLHSCANYMSEMGGEIKAQSKGEGKGSEFILIFPSS